MGSDLARASIGDSARICDPRKADLTIKHPQTDTVRGCSFMIILSWDMLLFMIYFI